MEKTCLQLEGGLNLRSHYVDTLLVRRDVLRLKKKGSACLEELLAHMGDTARQKASLRRSQVKSWRIKFKLLKKYLFGTSTLSLFKM